MKAINLGSGQRPFAAPFINVDINPRWNPDVVADGAHMPIFEDSTVDLVVAHHTVEHYGCGEAKSMVQECYRILKPGASLLVFVPDMRALAQRWLTRQMTDQVYFTNVYGAYMNDEADRHRFGYTRESMQEFLADSAAWSTVKAFDWRTIPGADIARDFWILGMEAVK